MSGVSLCAMAPLLRKRNEKTKAETSLKYMRLILFERSNGCKRPGLGFRAAHARHDGSVRGLLLMSSGSGIVQIPRGVDGRRPQAWANPWWALLGGTPNTRFNARRTPLLSRSPRVRSTLRRQTSELSRQAFSERISVGLHKPAIFFHMIFMLG